MNTARRDHLRLFVSIVLAPLVLVAVGWWMHHDASAGFAAHTWAARLAQGAVVAAAGALAVGVLGMLAAVFAGRVAMRSSASLAAVLDRTRRVLPWLLGTKVLLLALALLTMTGVVACWLYETANATPIRSAEGNFEALALTFFAGITWVAFVALKRLRRSLGEMFQPTPIDQWGREVDEDQAPGLWRAVRNAAAQVGAIAPRHIVVGLVDGFYVTAGDVRLLPGGQVLRDETMVLSLATAALMRPREMQSVIAHELGHFAGDDVQYTLRFAPMHAGMVRAIAAVSDDHRQHDSLFESPRALGQFVLGRMHRAQAHWSRQREFAADQLAGTVAGERAAACALVRNGAIAPVISTYLGEVFRRPEDAPDDILHGLVDYARRRGLEAPDLHAGAACAHPVDSHPTTLDRVRALGLDATSDLLAEACASVGDEGVNTLDRWLVDRVGVQLELSADLGAAALQQKRSVTAALRAAAAGPRSAVVQPRAADATEPAMS